MSNSMPFDIARLGDALRAGDVTCVDVIEEVLSRIQAAGEDRVWIHRASRDELLERAGELDSRADKEAPPLFGIPFAVKDNIDVAGWPTTAACPAFSYVADDSAPVVAALLDAGAMLIGKTNLDQFATGLVGMRSPYGAPRNPFDGDYVPGGSSSGSAVAVSSGLVSFALGTDTAGSGRVPAAFNNIVGLKPTRGRLSARGVVPACRSLDCVSVFALTADDANAVLAAVQGFDAGDPFSRDAAAVSPPLAPGAIAGLRIGIPDSTEFFGNANAEALFADAVERLRTLGAAIVPFDPAPFLDAARLLYDGPWVAERYAAVGAFIDAHPDDVHPVTRKIIMGGGGLSAADGFSGQYRLEAFRRAAEPTWRDVDMLMTPTTGTIYTTAEIEADPIRLNGNLGYYTNFMNLFDLCGVAVPAGFLGNGLPFGVTLVGCAFADVALLRAADELHRAAGLTLGATGLESPTPVELHDTAMGCVRLAVNGAHMSGLPLNHELTERGARLVRKCRTAPLYRLFALEDFAPPRPGLVRADPGGEIDVEVWEMPAARFGGFVAGVPAPLGIGTVTLDDGSEVNGFVCEPYATKNAPDITEFRSWRSWLVEK